MIGARSRLSMKRSPSPAPRVPPKISWQCLGVLEALLCETETSPGNPDRLQSGISGPKMQNLQSGKTGLLGQSRKPDYCLYLHVGRVDGRRQVAASHRHRHGNGSDHAR
jgi:hypothetical protein